MVAQQESYLPKAVIQPIYSVVAPVFNEEETLPYFYKRVVAVMEGLSEPFELLLVNDGSRDRSFQIMKGFHERDTRVRVIDFSRNFGHQIAISAGLDYARGQAIIIVDSDLQDPPEVIPRLIERWKKGAEVVYAQRARRIGETRFKLVTASLFYRLMRRITSVDIPRDVGDFRLMDRRVVDALVSMRKHHRFMRGLSAWVGFRQEAVLYDRQERFAGQTKYPLMKMIRFSLERDYQFQSSSTSVSNDLWFYPSEHQLDRYYRCRVLTSIYWCHCGASLDLNSGTIPGRCAANLLRHHW